MVGGGGGCELGAGLVFWALDSGRLAFGVSWDVAVDVGTDGGAEGVDEGLDEGSCSVFVACFRGLLTSGARPVIDVSATFVLRGGGGFCSSECGRYSVNVESRRPV